MSNADSQMSARCQARPGTANPTKCVGTSAEFRPYLRITPDVFVDCPLAFVNQSLGGSNSALSRGTKRKRCGRKHTSPVNSQ
jgi:hypothetical protein